MTPAKRSPAAFGKPDDIVDRDDVWAQLNAHWASKGPALVFGMGRRRAGKSWVLARYARAAHGIYYQATKRTAREQLAALSRIVGAHFGDAALQRGVPFPTWEALLGYVTDQAAGAPFLLVLDEFPYLSDAEPALTSILQQLWDHEWPSTRIRLVLNGSHITAMQRLEAADQPLYGRRTARLLFPPLAFDAAREFMPAHSSRDQLQLFAAFGGLPGHLALIDPGASVGENIAQHILAPSSRLADEAQHMLDAFLADADVHYSLIGAIANGERTWSRITSRLGKASGSLSRPMRWLEEMSVVARVVPVSETKPQTSKRAQYFITDSYVAFWHRFVAPMLAEGAVSVADAAVLWNERVAPRMDDYMGLPFEAACRSWVARTNRLPFQPTHVGSWWQNDSSNEIDIVALGSGGDVMVAECKWGAVNEQDLATLRQRATLLLADLPPDRQMGSVYYALFSAAGTFTPGVKRAIADGRVLGFTADDLGTTDGRTP